MFNHYNYKCKNTCTAYRQSKKVTGKIKTVKFILIFIDHGCFSFPSFYSVVFQRIISFKVYKNLKQLKSSYFFLWLHTCLLIALFALFICTLFISHLKYLFEFTILMLIFGRFPCISCTPGYHQHISR